MVVRKINIVRNKEKKIQSTRFYIQLFFALLCIWIGIEFSYFVKYLSTNGAEGQFYRPAGVDGFLPISSLMSLYYFILTGEIHWAHPAGLFILIAIVAVSFFIGKSFCSWFCPVGFLSELVGDFGEKIIGRKIKIPKLLDYPLRALKYLILIFFIHAIFFLMNEITLKIFLDGAYNQMSDVKMYYFFADISQTSLIVISVLFFLSIIFRNFWCRYLCPYGALLGVISFLSPIKIKRNVSTCIDCSLCTKACPSFIKVDKVKTVYSDECISCFNCVDACPVNDTLTIKTIRHKKISAKLIPYFVVLIFCAVTGLGMLTGNWGNEISKKEYLLLHEEVHQLDHIRSAKDIKALEESGKQNKIITNKKN